MELNQTMYQAVVAAYKALHHGKAIYYQGKSISYRKFIKDVDRMADILVNVLGVKKDDVVLVSQPNIPDVLILIYALNKIGAIVNSVHPFTPYNQLKNIIDRTGSKVAFLFEQRVAKEVEKFREIADMVYVTRIENHLPLFKKLVYHTFMNRSIRKTLGRFRGKFKGFKYVHKLRPTGKPVETCLDYKKNSVLLHSGSTTGDPKTICLCDVNFNFIAARTEEFISAPAETIVQKPLLSVLPSFHGFGFGVTMHLALARGIGTYLVPKFSSKDTAKIMNKTKISIICGVPTMFENLLKCEEWLNAKCIKDLKICFCGGDTMSISLKTRFDNAMKAHNSKAQVFEGYGLTEAVAVNCVNTFDHNKPGSIGYPASDAIFKIFDENDNELPIGKTGEICISSPAVMLGYFKDQKATEATIRNGFLHTGDLGHIDEDGFIFFEQRKKRVVKVSGVGVFPTEIEHLVETVPGVEGVCAIQIPDPKLQAAIKLFVIAKYFDEEGMKNQIIDTCKKYLIRWAIPKEIEFVKELPTTLLGKIDFRKLQEQENAKRGISNVK